MSGKKTLLIGGGAPVSAMALSTILQSKNFNVVIDDYCVDLEGLARDAFIGAIPDNVYKACPCGCGQKWKWARLEYDKHETTFIQNYLKGIAYAQEAKDTLNAQEETAETPLQPHA